MESSRTRPWPWGSSRTFLPLVSTGKSLTLVLASALSPCLWPCAERSSKFTRACISKGRNNAVKNSSKVTMNESTQVTKLDDNLCWSHIVLSYLFTNYQFLCPWSSSWRSSPWHFSPWLHHWLKLHVATAGNKHCSLFSPYFNSYPVFFVQRIIRLVLIRTTSQLECTADIGVLRLIANMSN